MSNADPFPSLRQVVAERGVHHPVQSFRRDACRATGVRAPPGLTRHVGVLRPELEAALGPAVEAVPESGRSLDHARVSPAQCASDPGLNPAGGFVETGGLGFDGACST